MGIALCLRQRNGFSLKGSSGFSCRVMVKPIAHLQRIKS
jgi:hypothetical protein